MCIFSSGYTDIPANGAKKQRIGGIDGLQDQSLHRGKQTVTFEAEILNTKSLGNYYFAGCTALREVYLSMNTITPFWSSIKSGRSGAFMDCTALENVVIQLTTGEISGISSDYDVFKKLYTNRFK